MSAELTVDMTEFMRGIKKVAKGAGIGIKKVTESQMGLLATDLVKSTPPRGMTGMKGKKAIRRDMNLIFAHGNAELIDWLWLRFGRGKGNRLVFNSEGNLARMKGWHKHWRRSGGKGPVRFNKQIVERYQNNGVAIDMSNQMYVPNSAFKPMLKVLESHVGILKATWMSAVRRWRGKAPSFVTRHRSHGSAYGRIDTNGNGQLVAVSSPHYRPKNMLGLVKIAMGRRERDVKKHLRKRIKADIARAGAA